MNKVVLTGHLTSNLELRYTQSNTEVCNFSLAVQRNYKNQNGEYGVDFINCIAFKSTAKLINEYLKKGDLIGIEGKIQVRNYKNKEDKTVYVTEVIVERIEFLKMKNAQKNENIVQNIDLHKREEIETVVENDPFADFGDSVTIDDDFLD